MIDLLPQSLKFFFSKIFIERIIFNLCFVSVCKHILKDTVIINSLNKRMYAIRHRFQFIRKLGNSSTLYILTVAIRNLIIIVDIIISDKVFVDFISGAVVNKRRYIIHLNILAFEVFFSRNCRSVIQNSFDIRLQIRNKSFIAFTCNNSKSVNIVYRSTTTFNIHTITVLIYAQTQSTTNLLAFCGVAVGVFKRTNLKYIWVVPTFTKRRVRENKPRWLIKGKQAFLVLQNKVIG